MGKLMCGTSCIVFQKYTDKKNFFIARPVLEQSTLETRNRSNVRRFFFGTRLSTESGFDKFRRGESAQSF